MVTYESICRKLGFDFDRFFLEREKLDDEIGADMAEDDQRFADNPLKGLSMEEVDFLEERLEKQANR